MQGLPKIILPPVSALQDLCKMYLPFLMHALEGVHRRKFTERAVLVTLMGLDREGKAFLSCLQCYNQIILMYSWHIHILLTLHFNGGNFPQMTSLATLAFAVSACYSVQHTSRSSCNNKVLSWSRCLINFPSAITCLWGVLIFFLPSEV